jgi:hypothetical protein
MKTLLLVAGSRSGSDFFQSLLDGHSQVMQFPGLIRTNKELIKVLSSHDPLKISSYFIEQYKHFFDSRVGYSEKVERHNMLGKNKNQYYIVNKEEFKKIFLNLFQKKPIGNSFHNIYQKILLLHQAYAITSGQDINKKKIMIINCHLVKYAKYFSNELHNIDFDIIHTIRNPLSAVSSPVHNWLNYDEGKHFFANSVYFQLNLIVNGIKELEKINKKLFLIQLEMLHKNHNGVMNDFCKTYNLSYDKCMENATFFNLEWWGDKISGKDLNGINKNFKITFNEKVFYKKDISFLEYILSNYINSYNYQFTQEKKKIFFKLSPLKCEILTWQNTFKHKRIKHILSIPFFYFLRIIFINKFSQNKLRMPHSFGSNINQK